MTVLPPIERIPRDVFVAEYWSPRPGEHTSMIGTTGGGKTTLGMALLRSAVDQNPNTRGLVLAMKPHRGPAYRGRRATGDPTVAELAKQYGGRIIRHYPPPPQWLPFWPFKKPDNRLDVFWPKHAMDPDEDIPAHHAAFRKAILDSYKKGGVWLFADETYSLCEELDLDRQLITLWTKGRSMEVGLIGATQKPTHVPRWMFSQARHFFLWNDPDKDTRRRYAEIGGADPREVMAITESLSEHECLYLNPREKTMCVLV